MCADDVDLQALGKRTTGFTGADIENVVNQAALKAASDGCDRVHNKYFEDARDRVLMGEFCVLRSRGIHCSGRERKSGRLPDEKANNITAYHEAGHMIVALFTKDALPIHKCTILPRGQSLGHVSRIVLDGIQPDVHNADGVHGGEGRGVRDALADEGAARHGHGRTRCRGDHLWQGRCDDGRVR